MQAPHQHPSRRCEAFPARSSPQPGPRTTCCCLGALRPSLRKFTPRRASPERLEHAFQPKLPGELEPAPAQSPNPWSSLGPMGPAELQPSSRLGCWRPPRLSRTPQGPGPRAGGCEERAPRRASSPRWGLETEGILPLASRDRHDSRLPEDLEAVLLSHLGCGGGSPALPSLPTALAPSSQPVAHTAPGQASGTPATLPQPHAPGRASRSHPTGQQGGSGELRCPLHRPTGMGGVVCCPPAHSGDRGPEQPRALGTTERGEDRGGEAREGLWVGESGRQHSPLAGPGPAARARSRQTWVSRLLSGVRGAPSEARREGATRMRAPAGSTRPHAHTPSRQPRPRADILAAAGSHGAPGRSPSARRAGASPSSARRAIWARASLSLSSAPVWGRLPRTPARQTPLPLSLPLAVQSPGARAQPMCAAASLHPGAQWPRPRRSCAP